MTISRETPIIISPTRKPWLASVWFAAAVIRALQDRSPDDVSQLSRGEGWHDEVVRSPLQHVQIELHINETRHYDYRRACRSSARGLEHVCPGTVRERGVGQHQRRLDWLFKRSTGLGIITNAPRPHPLIEEHPFHMTDVLQSLKKRKPDTQRTEGKL